MTWSEDCELAAGDSNDAFGQAIGYRDGVTQATTLTCPVTRERRERRRTPAGTQWVRIRKVFIDDSEQAVRLDAVFTIDGVDYSVESLENAESGGRTIANVRQSEIEEASRPGYRGD